MPSEYRIHEAAEIFPPMDEETYSQFKADIEAHGQHEAAILWEDKILDGRNRYRACCDLGIEVDTCELTECDDPVAYVLSANLHRRHLTTQQRAFVGARARAIYDRQAKGRERSGKGADGSGGRGKKKNPVAILPQGLVNANGKSRDAAGAAVGVSGKTLDKASRVQREGSEALVKACETNDVPLDTAVKLVQAVPDKRQQAAIVREGPAAVKEAVRQTQEESDLSKRWRTFRAAWNKASEDERNEVAPLIQELLSE